MFQSRDNLKINKVVDRREFICRGCKALSGILIAGGLFACKNDDFSDCATYNVTLSTGQVGQLKSNGFLNIIGAIIFYSISSDRYTAFGNCCPEGGGGELLAEGPNVARCQKESIQTYDEQGNPRGLIDYANKMLSYNITQNSDGTITIFK